MNRTTRTHVVVASLLFLALGSSIRAASSAAELTLDSTAVREMISLALPEPWRLELPGSGEIRVSIEAPREVRFRDGGIETEIPVRFSGLDRAVVLHVRYVPSVEPLTGIVRLEPESVVPELRIPFEIDIRDRVPSVELPRRLEWELELAGGKKARVTCFVQGLVVEGERLRIDLGLLRAS